MRVMTLRAHPAFHRRVHCAFPQPITDFYMARRAQILIAWFRYGLSMHVDYGNVCTRLSPQVHAKRLCRPR